ncbi:MAG TPA: hypothetical protein DFI63_02920 [Lachnospiraceae bacterium]|nr:hypothetical protein [Lachnospiraceae bacterium]
MGKKAGRRRNYINVCKQKNTIIFVIAVSMILSACGAAKVQKENDAYVEETENEASENAREEPKTEAVPEEQETDESITEEAKGQIPEDAKEYLEYLFDYLHPDRSQMVDLKLYETEDKLYYEWKSIDEAGELTYPIVLAYEAYKRISKDEERYGYTEYMRGSYFMIINCGGYWEIDPDTGEIIPVAKELLEYLFDYLHPDREGIVDIELYETENRLCYKWKIEFKSGEISDPDVLAYYGLTQDGLYHLYAIYDEIWDTHYDENGETYKEHTRDSYRNFWIVNSETKELIPRSIFNKESEEEYIIWNERYLDMLRLYPEESE